MSEDFCRLAQEMGLVVVDCYSLDDMDYVRVTFRKEEDEDSTKVVATTLSADLEPHMHAAVLVGVRRAFAQGFIDIPF